MCNNLGHEVIRFLFYILRTNFGKLINNPYSPTDYRYTTFLLVFDDTVVYFIFDKQKNI